MKPEPVQEPSTQPTKDGSTSPSTTDPNNEPITDPNDQSISEQEETNKDTNTAQAEVSEGPVLRTGKSIQGVKTAIVLPGIAEAQKAKVFE